MIPTAENLRTILAARSMPVSRFARLCDLDDSVVRRFLRDGGRRPLLATLKSLERGVKILERSGPR